jgi:hypothetical protein
MTPSSRGDADLLGAVSTESVRVHRGTDGARWRSEGLLGTGFRSAAGSPRCALRPRSSQRRTPTPIWPLTRCDQVHSIEPQPLINVRVIQENGGTTKAVPAARSRPGPGVLLASPELVARTITAVRRENGAAEDAERDEAMSSKPWARSSRCGTSSTRPEQARILRLLIERIEVAPDGISIALHAAGIRSLVAELASKKAADSGPEKATMMDAAD